MNITDAYKMSVINWLNSALKTSGKTKSGLGDYVGVSRQAVHGWFKTGRASKEKLTAAAEYFGCNPPQFLIGLDSLERNVKEDDTVKTISPRKNDALLMLESLMPNTTPRTTEFIATCIHVLKNRETDLSSKELSILMHALTAVEDKNK